MSYKIYVDGCYLKEFNMAGIGGYLLKGDETIFEFSEQVMEQKYFNIHERYALKRSLEKAIEFGIENEIIQVFSDDEGLMRVLNHSEKKDYINDNNLLEEIIALISNFQEIKFTYIPRSENTRADKLSRKHIETILFKDNQILDGALNHPKWISKNNYPKNNTNAFKLEQQLVNQYLVLHFHPNKEEKCMQLDVSYAKIENEIVSHTFEESVKFVNKFWQSSSFNTISNHLKELSKQTKNIGIVLHDEYLMLDQVLRGRKAIEKNAITSFNTLIDSLRDLNKIIVHKEQKVFNEVFYTDCIKQVTRNKMKI